MWRAIDGEHTVNTRWRHCEDTMKTSWRNRAAVAPIVAMSGFELWSGDVEATRRDMVAAIRDDTLFMLLSRGNAGLRM